MSECIIKAENVKKIYTLPGEEIAALQHIDLQVFKGDFISIMGPSGSGKTTLLDIVGCLDAHDHVRIFLGHSRGEGGRHLAGVLFRGSVHHAPGSNVDQCQDAHLGRVDAALVEIGKVLPARRARIQGGGDARSQEMRIGVQRPDVGFAQVVKGVDVCVYVEDAGRETGLPVTDPVRFDAEPLAGAIRNSLKL